MMDHNHINRSLTEPARQTAGTLSAQVYDTVILCHGHSLSGGYPIPPGYHGEFIKSSWIGAQKVDIYQIVKDGPHAGV